MYISLARKYRPSKFEDMCGQEVPVKILQNSILTKKVHHAYIFSGVRGTGKTTAARIFAKALNCINGPTPVPCDTCEPCKQISYGNFIDVIEMDAGSQSSVEDIRNLKERALYPPVRGRFKVFIIDEAHMLSISAFNALLKIFEEPPEFDVFILATTEPQKIPETVQSRAIRIEFRKISPEKIVERLRIICDKEGILCDDETLFLIAQEGQGSLRDSISMLEAIWMFSGKNEIKKGDVENIIGIAPRSIILSLVEAVLNVDTKRVAEITENIIKNGYNLKRVCRDFAEHVKKICYILDGIDKDESLQMIIDRSKANLEHSLRIMNAILRSEDNFIYSISEEVAFKMLFFKLCYIEKIRNIREIIEGTSKDEKEKKVSDKDILTMIINYLEMSGRTLIAEKIKSCEAGLSDGVFEILIDDARVARALEDIIDDIEVYLEGEGVNVKIRIKITKDKSIKDPKEILGSDFFELDK